MIFTKVEKKSIEKKSYPYIGIYKEEIVLFVEKNKGMSLGRGHSLYSDTVIGLFYTDWVEENFELFIGDITISNENNIS